MPNTIDKLSIEKHKQQQDRLNSRLNERLEYLGIYFQRNPQDFFNNLPSSKQKKLLKRLKLIYTQILFDYFSTEDNTIGLINRFVEEAFFANLPLNKVVEIHLNLIDSLERQLKIEGLGIEHLSDFRLTLIDVIAHLGELYRNAIDQKVSG